MVLRLDQLDISMLTGFVDQHESPGAYVDRATGEWWLGVDHEVIGDDGSPLDEDEVEAMDLVAIGGDGSDEAYRDMETFAEAITEPDIRRRLLESLQGKGAFRRFKGAVWNQPEEVSRAWTAYRDGCAELRVLEWAEDNELVSSEETQAAGRTVVARLDALLAGL